MIRNGKVIKDKRDGRCVVWRMGWARFHTPGMSFDLGRITVAAAHKIAWLYCAWFFVEAD